MILKNDFAQSAQWDLLERYRILETYSDKVFDLITSLAAQIVGTPFALLTIFDSDRRWCLSAYGIQSSQMTKEEGFCSTAILEDGVYVIEDTLSDQWTCEHSWVTGEPGFRFYAGMPFSTPEGYRLGTLCVMDKVPRELSQTSREVLRNLSEVAVKHMELILSHVELGIKMEKPPLLPSASDQLLATAIHDLRTPLSTITMLANLIAEQQVGPLNPGQDKMIHSICTACKEMATQLTNYAATISQTPTAPSGKVAPP